MGARACTVRSENPLLASTSTGPNFLCKSAGWKMRPTMEMEGEQAGPQTTSPAPCRPSPSSGLQFTTVLLIRVPQLQAVPTKFRGLLASLCRHLERDGACRRSSREKHCLEDSGLNLQVPGIPSMRAAGKIGIFLLQSAEQMHQQCLAAHQC